MIAANRKGEENENNIGSKERGAALQQKKKPIIKSIQEYVNTCPFMAGGKVDEAYISLFMTYVIEPAEGESIYIIRKHTRP